MCPHRLPDVTQNLKPSESFVKTCQSMSTRVTRNRQTLPLQQRPTFVNRVSKEEAVLKLTKKIVFSRTDDHSYGRDGNLI